MAEKLAHRVYNIASGRATSNRDAFEAVRKAVPGARCSALKPGSRPGPPAIRRPISDARPRSAIAREHSIETGVAAYIDWLRTNPQ